MQETQRIALFHALKRKDLSNVQTLATEDATLLSSPLGNSGLYPIHVAVQEHDFVMIDYFISQHIDLNTAIYAPSYPEHEKTPLYLATELGYIDIIEQLVRVSPKPAHNKEYLLLHAAARIGRLDIIQYLFEAYFDRNFTSLIQTDSTGQTPLHFAARNGHVHILDYYYTISGQMYRAYFGASKEEQKTIFFDNNLSLSVQINAPGTLNHDKTALNLAVEHGHLNCVQMLTKNHVTFQPEFEVKCRLIHTAALHGHLEIVQYYIKKYSHVLNEADSNGQTPLLWAASAGHILVVEYLLSMGATFDKTTNSDDSQYRKSPLYWAVRNGHARVVKRLIEAGAVADIRCGDIDQKATRTHINFILISVNITRAPGNLRYLLIHLAAQEGYLEIVQLLLEKFPHWLNETDANGQTPLLWASSAGHTEIVEHLLSLGADFNRGTKDDRNNGKSPLYWAVRGGHTHVVKRLINAGAIADARIESMDYLLIHIAAQEGHLETIRFLLERYPHWLNETDTYEQTPLLWAASTGHIDVVKYLLSLNPDIDKATSRTGIWDHEKTARDWAAKRGYSVIVDMLDTHRRDAQNRTASHMEDEALERTISHYKPAYINRRPSFFKHASSTFSPSRSLGENLRDFVSPEGQHVVVETLQCDPIKGKKQLEHQVCLMQRAYPDKGFYTSFHSKTTWNSKQNDTGRIVSPYLTGEPADVYLERIHSIDAFVYTLQLITKELVRLHEKGIILNNIKLNKIIISSNHDELNVTYTGFKYARDINDAKAPVAPDTQNRHFAPELVKSSTIFSFQYFSTLKPNYNQDIFSFGHMLNELLYSHPLGAQAAESFPSMTVFIRKALDTTPGNRPTIQSFHESLKSDCLISIQVGDEWEILNGYKA